ncbi:hypothetical protein SAMN06265795_12035 [Noviherbaspirillum humi]|uniref:Uncharacterized protein n=1 Tax=Noviherbaspirillum humi TaxID=1688639 RepID=A0A239L9I1_9BURK|nr:hypothetical protein SAMN06265795_12035 [Noviherbaspirillum humi]
MSRSSHRYHWLEPSETMFGVKRFQGDTGTMFKPVDSSRPNMMFMH